MANDAPSKPTPASQKLFQLAEPELRQLIKMVMMKERQEQHKKNRQDIYQTLLEYIRESAK